VCYRDPVDCPDDKHEVHEFSVDLREFRNFLSRIKATGGGDDPEDYVGAIEAVRALQWRPSAAHAIVWIADANAHGRRYHGKINHEEESGKLRPLVEQLVELNAKFQGFSVAGGAVRTFTKMQRIYQRKNPQLFFRFQDFKPEAGTVEKQAKTLGLVMSNTLRTCAHEFLNQVPPTPLRSPLSRSGTGMEPARASFDSVRADRRSDGARTSRRAVTFHVPT
jgi:hypothetical protein